MAKFMGALVLSLALCAVANAGDDKHDNNYGFNNFDQHHDRNDFDKHDNDGWNGRPVAAPEIDPASALSGLTLLGAGLAVIRGRRLKK